MTRPDGTPSPEKEKCEPVRVLVRANNDNEFKRFFVMRRIGAVMVTTLDENTVQFEVHPGMNPLRPAIDRKTLLKVLKEVGYEPMAKMTRGQLAGALGNEGVDAADPPDAPVK